jgi:putative aldouronate transport system substrate-binding protein
MFRAKRILCTALAAATIVPMMFASSSGVASAAATKPIVTLKIFTGDKKIQGLDRVEAAVNAYLKQKNTGLAIDWSTMSWDDLGPKLNTMLQTGQDADVVFVSQWNGAGYAQHAQNGELTDLTSYLKTADGKKVTSLLGSFLNGSKVNNKTYALPTNKEQAHNFGFLVQTKEMKKLGINAKNIKTLDDLAKYFDKAKADGYTPICSSNMDSVYKFLDWDVVSDDGTPGAFDPKGEKTVVDQFTDSKTIAFYKEMKTFHDKGYFSSDVMTSKGEETDMATGKYFCGSWSLMPGKAITESTSLKLGLTQIDITPIEKTNRESQGAMLAIPKASTKKSAAFKFISMLYTDKKLINLMTYGVQGKDYTKVGTNTIKVNANTDFSSAGGWIMGNEFNNYLTTSQSKTLWSDIAAYNKKSKTLRDLGFVFNGSKYHTQIANLQGVVTKYYPELFYGTCDVDSTVASFKADLKAQGETTVLNAMQTQYNTFCKVNHR